MYYAFHDFYTSPYIVRMVESRIIGCMEHVVCIWESKNRATDYYSQAWVLLGTYK
jgi:hypothetical protein